jgi:hypothetical protein
MPKSPVFTIRFGERRTAKALTVSPDGDPEQVIQHFRLAVPSPAIFVSGGAAGMTDEDYALTEVIVQKAIAPFAQQHGVTLIDGGTNAGVMKMLGDVRQKRRYRFPLIGVAPRLKIEYPGFANPAAEAQLHQGHSHFVLVESDSWGKESRTIVDLTRAISQRQQPMLGILINGGKIAEHDIYLATSVGEDSVPVLVLDGSGRKADEVSTAVKTGKTSSKIIRAIVKGGRIDLVNIHGGADAMLNKLSSHFGVVRS